MELHIGIHPGETKDASSQVRPPPGDFRMFPLEKCCLFHIRYKFHFVFDATFKLIFASLMSLLLCFRFLHPENKTPTCPRSDGKENFQSCKDAVEECYANCHRGSGHGAGDHVLYSLKKVIHVSPFLR